MKTPDFCPDREIAKKAVAFDANAIADSLEKHVVAFQKALTRGVLLATVVGLGTLPGTDNEVKILSVTLDKAAAYNICLAVYGILYFILTTHTLNICCLVKLIDRSNIRTAMTKLLIVPGVINPFAWLGASFKAVLLSSLGFGVPFLLLWFMYLTTIRLELEAGGRSWVRYVFLAASVATCWSFAHCYLIVLRKLKSTKSPLFEPLQRLAWYKFGTAVLCFWCGAFIYHCVRGTSVGSLWECSDIVVFYPVLYSLPWWGEFKRQWLLFLGGFTLLCGIGALYSEVQLCGILVVVIGCMALIAAIIKWKWCQFEGSGTFSRRCH
ncbi:MAG: hypothetical protein ACYSWW_15720, partial [Planctomycetota bacterium]|jgi:hypothetical protein